MCTLWRRFGAWGEHDERRAISVRGAAGNAGGLFDGMQHLQVGFEAECDGPDGYPCGHSIDNSSHHVPGLLGRAADKSQSPASAVALWRGPQSKRHLDICKELLPLLYRKTSMKTR
jgi:hypothetical protein